MPFNRFPMVVAHGYKHKIRSTGQFGGSDIGSTPATWYLRWDAPTSSQSAVIEIFVPGTQLVSVFVSSSMTDTDWTFVPGFKDRYPTLADPAGSNTRDPQKRTLTFTARGGVTRFYKFIIVPTISLTMKLDMDIYMFFTSSFVANVAMLLGISPNQISVANVKKGSVILDYSIVSQFPVTNASSIPIHQVRVVCLNVLSTMNG